MSIGADEIVELVGLQLGRSEVRLSDHLIEDLGADSADLLNLVVALEDRLGISIGEEDLSRLSTVEDLLLMVAARL